METNTKPRKTPKKKAEATAQKKIQAHWDKLLTETVNAQIGFFDGRCDPRRLWEVDGVCRYRINWLDWLTGDIIRSVFCHVSDTNPKPKESKDYEPHYKITIVA